MANPKNLKTWKRQSLNSEPQKPHSHMALVSAFYGTDADAAYVRWLSVERGMSLQEGWDYCGRMDRRTLISQTHEASSKPSQKTKWKLKSKWWKPASLSYRPFDRYQVIRQAEAYKAWKQGEEHPHTLG